MTPKEAVAIQKRLAPLVRTDCAVDLTALRLIAGIDVSVRDKMSQAAVVVMTWPDLAVVETVTARQPTPFPYVPGLLTFREGPVLETAFARLRHEPDLLLVDGSGIAHPRRMGIAAHLGLLADRPSIGCAKTRLFGTHDEVGPRHGDRVPLLASVGEIGAVVRTRDRVAPVYVSPGHRCDIASAVAITLAATGRYRLPEPIRAAHRAAGRVDHAAS